MMRINILPNLLSLGNMYCGLMSIVYTFNGKFSQAAWLILLGILFDVTDGQVARLTNSTSDFGKELDSLSDLVSFGIAPALLVYANILFSFDKIGLLLVIVYAITGSLRLARFNVQTGGGDGYFTGLPIPAAGGLLSSFVLLKLKYDEPIFTYLALFIVFLSFLMISNIRYPKRQLLEVSRGNLYKYLFLAILALSIYTLKPTLCIFLVLLSYVSFGPLNVFVKRRAAEEEVIPTQEELSA